MMRRMARGEGKAGCVIWAALLFSVSFVAYKIVPVKLTTLELKDYMEELALMPDTARKDAEFFEKEIYRRAQDLRLPCEEKDVKVKKTGREVIMDVKFTIMIDLIVTEYPYVVDLHLDRPIFLS